jgi:uncharacterized protein YodC (DUF2158 family)
MNAVKKGDLVELKSGGPIMTVLYTDDYTMAAGIKNGDAYCVWFDGKTPKWQVFDLGELKKHQG